MRRPFLLSLAATILGSFWGALGTPITPPPACVAASLAQYLALGPAGCSVGEVAFNNFSFQVLAFGGGAVPIGAGDIRVTPVAHGEQYSLSFSSAGFRVVGTQFVTYLLAYSIDPHPIIITIHDEMETETPVFPGLASITTDLCVGRPFVEGSCLPPGMLASMNVFHNGMAFRLRDSVTFASPQADIGVRNFISLLGNGTGSADFTRLTNGVVVVPEPATWILVGTGLAGGLWRRRRLR